MGTQSVTVSAGSTINSNIHDTFALEVRFFPVLLLDSDLYDHENSWGTADLDSDLEHRRLRWNSYWFFECGVGASCALCNVASS